MQTHTVVDVWLFDCHKAFECFALETRHFRIPKTPPHAVFPTRSCEEVPLSEVLELRNSGTQKLAAGSSYMYTLSTFAPLQLTSIGGSTSEQWIISEIHVMCCNMSLHGLHFHIYGRILCFKVCLGLPCYSSGYILSDIETKKFWKLWYMYMYMRTWSQNILKSLSTMEVK